jgi:hypothetical protein
VPIAPEVVMHQTIWRLICSHLGPLEQSKRATGGSATTEINGVHHNCQLGELLQIFLSEGFVDRFDRLRKASIFQVDLEDMIGDAGHTDYHIHINLEGKLHQLVLTSSSVCFETLTSGRIQYFLSAGIIFDSYCIL